MSILSLAATRQMPLQRINQVPQGDFMLFDANDIDDGGTLVTDLCIVGAGAAGISIAKEFSASSLRVCLLESGGFEHESDTQALSKGEVKGRYYYDLDVGRLRLFGGTTNHWTGWSRPLDSIDFESRDYIEGSGWPITRSDLEPYYQKAQQVLELGDYSYSPEENADQLPLFFTKSFPAERVTARVWKRSPPTRFGKVYRSLITNSENISLYLHANVTEIETNVASDSVTQVNVSTLKGKHFKVRAKLFILCAGGIEVPRLMLVSNALKPHGLGNDYDQLGRHFMLHPQVSVGNLLIDSRQTDLFKIAEDRKGKGIRAGLSVAESVQRKEGLPNHAVLFTSRKLSKVAGLKQLLKRLLVNKSPNSNDIVTDIEKIMQDVSGSPDIGEFATLEIVMRMDHLPNSNSRILLGETKDAFGNSQAAIDWQMSSQDFQSVRRTIEIIGETFGELGLGRLQIKKWLLATDKQEWPEDSEWDFHHMGGTRMSNDPATGVVDSDCRVYGVSNLYIASSSVFTTAGFSNPTMTIVALALRLADHIKTRTLV